MSAETLPTEIWLRVALFIPDHHLANLSSVSRFFYDIWTDRMYRHLLLDDDRPARLKAKLRRLRDDPEVRQIVQSIAVHPRAIRSACIRSGRNQKRTGGTIRPQCGFRSGVANVTSGEDLDLADAFLESLADLPNCDELQVDWERPSIEEASFCLPLLKTLMLSIGPRLRRLSLSMALDVLPSLLSDVHSLPQLESLALNMSSNVVDPQRMEDAAKHQEALGRFVNSLSPTLQSLSITCLCHFRLCTLFNNLAVFAQLRSLRLHLPFDHYHLDDTSGLNQFLRAHTTISHLSFTPVHCCNRYSSLWEPAITQWSDADTWLHSVFADVEFHDLRTLELGLNIAGGAPRVLLATAYIGNVASNVGCLTILDTIASVDELNSIIRPFAANGKGPTKKVVLNLQALSQPVFELLTATLPRLGVLDLTYQWTENAGGDDATAFVASLEALKSRQRTSVLKKIYLKSTNPATLAACAFERC